MGFLGSVGSSISNAVSSATGGSSGVTGGFLDLIPGLGDARAQERANKQNLQLDQLNKAWMERMSNSAYQRAMLDMKKAGLNPMLAYMQGGASVPSSAAASVAPVSKTGLANAALGAYTGITSAQAQAQNANTAQAQAESSISLQGAQTAETVAKVENTQANTKKTIDSIKNQKVKRELEQSQIPLQKVKESAAEMAQKGLGTLEKMSNNLLRNSAKPSMNSRTLAYENPIKKAIKEWGWGSKPETKGK